MQLIKTLMSCFVFVVIENVKVLAIKVSIHRFISHAVILNTRSMKHYFILESSFYL